MEKRVIVLGVLAGLLGGIASFGVARLRVEPAIAAAIGYEEARSHAEAQITGEHVGDHEIFSRALQENVGAGVGTIAFAIAVGALFAVVFITVSTHVRRRHIVVDPRLVAVMLAVAGFVSISLVPFAVYPANPPSVGLADTIAERTTSYMAMVGLSVGFALLALVVAVRLTPRIGGWAAIVSAGLGYIVAVSCASAVAMASAVLPRFDEVPQPLRDADGALVLPGFPADVLADFRLNALLTQAILWLVLGATFVVGLARALTSRSVAHSTPDSQGLMHASR